MRKLWILVALLTLWGGTARAQGIMPAMLTSGTVTLTAVDTGTCTGNTSGCVLLNISGLPSVSVQVTGSYSGTIQFETSSDRVNWFPVNMTPSGGGVPVTNTGTTGIWFGTGTLAYRARMSAHGSGSALVTVIAKTTQALAFAPTGAGASFSAAVLEQTASTNFPNGQDMSALGTGLVQNTTGTGVQSIATTTGSGNVVLATGPTMTLTNATGLPVTTGLTGLGAGVATFLATPSSANLATAVTDETGSGLLVFATSPTLTTPVLGTPTSVNLTNGTALPLGGIVAGADDTVMISNGSTWQAKAVGDCQDSGGNHLNYTASTNTVSCGTTSSGGGGGARWDQITAAGGSATTANGNNAITVNFANTTAGQQSWTFGETSSSSGGGSGGTATQAVLGVKTLATSTAVGIYVLNQGSSPGLRIDDVASDTTPFCVDSGGSVSIQGQPSGCAPRVALDVGGLNGSYTQYWDDGTDRIGIFSDQNKASIGTATAHPFSLFSNNGNPHLMVRSSSSGAIDILKHANPPTSIATGAAGLDGYYMHFGGDDAIANGYFLISFGYAGATNCGNCGVTPPAYFGGQEISNTSNTNMDMVLGTRSATTDTAPIERMRWTNDGLVKFVGSPAISTGTVPGISGCSADTQTGGAYAGTFTSRTSGACTVTLTFASSAPAGYSCAYANTTTPANLYQQSGGIANTSVSTGTTVTGDVIRFHCMGY